MYILETITVVQWLHRSPYQIWEKVAPCLQLANKYLSASCAF